MPVEVQHPVQKVLDFLKSRQALERTERGVGRRARRVSFEYILFDGVNDSVTHANELVRLLHGIRCRVNLIRLNPGSDGALQPAGEKATNAFQQTLRAKGMIATVRRSRGQDIDAACGLLSTRRLLT